MRFTDENSDKQVELISKLMHHLPDGAIAINSDLIICAANRKICIESGYSPYELYGEDIHLLIEDVKHEKHRRHLKGWFSHPVPMELHKRNKLSLKTFSGELKDVQIKIFAIEDWSVNGMFQTGDVVKPSVFGCAMIRFDG